MIVDRTTRPAASYSAYTPATLNDVFAFRLAAKLGDTTAARHYAELAERYSTAHLLTAFHRAVSRSKNGNLSRRFHELLQPLVNRSGDGGGSSNGRHKLIAIRVERRAIGAAVFNGDRLIFARARQLSSVPGKAIASSVDFIERIVRQFDIRSVVLESIPNGHEKHRKNLQIAITDALAGDEIYAQHASPAEFFAAFAHPPVATRSQLRAIASQIWPVLDEQPGRPWTHDAAMLGLYVQIEALFENVN